MSKACYYCELFARKDEQFPVFCSVGVEAVTYHYGVLTMITARTRKTSLENEHLRNYDYFAIIPSCSHFTMLAKNLTTGLVRALLN